MMQRRDIMLAMLQAQPAKKKRAYYGGHSGKPDPRPGVVYAIRVAGEKAIRYVGKSAKYHERKSSHLQRLKNHKHSNPHLQRWFDIESGKGKTVEVFVLQECLPGTIDACESEWIARLRAKGHPLCNCTDGGDGGWDFTEGTKKRLSEISKEKWCDPKYVEAYTLATGRKVLSAYERKRRAGERARNKLIWMRNQQLSLQRKSDRESFKTLTHITHAGTAFIPLTNGLYAKVDAEDAPSVGKYLWSAQRKGRQIRAKSNVAAGSLLSRFIMQAEKGDEVSVLNGDALDCRKANLRRKKTKGTF